eukprot:CAMPEP_0113317584 /NCGR_PEP_ID=MMETSP0010_2-20120614/12430_1 /TAXON_ID=216773 ORGANISM="Corethron hystrix, Strain 308" /NCGR_SAMPLE_ID=MMETSP0010_2 /ASSEMBLY_ACC=CAM_ASM_000155 /LENGTH=283 /DNA_ID=CAMNT_0000174587 /DNA_START=539 /DNA_END=1387 /DNA_ORIENTATION=+ /assembly_acc=CAM_ASM_000155
MNCADLSSVRAAALDILAGYPRGIDILVNNAGISYTFDDSEVHRAGSTAQDLDVLFGINYLSHFLFTELLRPHLATASGRIVQMTSGFHYLVDGSALLPTLDGGKPLAAAGQSSCRGPRHVSRAYANSKLAQIWHARSLATRMQKDGVSMVCACPSWVGTGIAGEEGRDFLQKYAFPPSQCGKGITSVLNAMFRSKEELGNEVCGGSGTQYVGNSRVIENLAPGRELWMTSEWVTKLGWRDGIVRFFSLVILVFQQVFYEEFILQEVSPNANDAEGQEALYTW